VWYIAAASNCEQTMPLYRDRLEAADRRALYVWLLVGVIGALVAWRFFFVAFPEAAVDFRVSRPAALERARQFLTAQGFSTEGYESSIVFDLENTAKTYLERELGLEQANRLMAGEVAVWYWDARFFRSRQKEEFRVRISPAGRVTGFTRVLEEAKAGESPEREAALARAEEFLRGPLGVKLEEYDALAEEANSIERPNRRDWSFTWERRNFKAKDAPYRLRVTLHGGRIGGYEEFLKVPEAWTRDFERLRSSNIFWQWIGQVPGAFLQGAVFLVLFDLGRRGLIRWRAALQLGFVLAVLFLVMNVNEWPLSRHGYDTNSSYGGFFVEQMLLAVLLSVVLGMIVALAVAAAEPLYRKLAPEKLRLEFVLSLRLPAGEGLPQPAFSFRFPGLRTKEFFLSCVIGLAMTAAHIGFVVLFYVIGQKFGFWLPQEVKYTNAVSTALPWIYPLAISIYAATSEEFLFRLFAIPVLLRLTRSKLAAIVLPALIWGFLHSAYPVQPGYARGVEVAIIGIVAGFVMLRWGIFATLAWHYTVDALLIGLFLLRSESLYFFLSGVVVVAAVLIPLGISVAFWKKNGGFLADEALLNRSEPLPERIEEPPPEAAVPPAPAVYERVSPEKLRLALAAGAIGLVLALTVRPEAIGNFVRVEISSTEAAQRAEAILRERGLDPESYRRATTFIEVTDSLANEFLRRQVGVTGVNKILEEKVPPAFWRVRFFRDSEKEEYRVILTPDGSLHTLNHLLEEEAPGANLTKEEAQARAAEFLSAVKKLDLAKWRVVEATSDKRRERTDHTFVWEEIEPLTPGAKSEEESAHVRASVEVAGDKVASFRLFVKIPDEWRRQQTEFSIPVVAHTVLRILFYAGLGLAALVIFFMNLKQQNVPWKRLAGWAWWGALAMMVVLLLNWQQLLANYDTQIPYRTFLAILLMGQFLFVALAYSGIFFLFGLGWFFLARAFGTERLPPVGGLPAAAYRDAFWLAMAGAGVLAGLGRLRPLADLWWPTVKYSSGAAIPGGLDAMLPAAAVAASAVTSALFIAAAIALAAGFLGNYARTAWIQYAFLVLTALVLAGRGGSGEDFAKNFLLELILVTVVWWGVRKLFRFNVAAYILTVVALSVVRSAISLLSQPQEFYRWNGYALFVLLAAVLAWPWLAASRRERAAGHIDSGSVTT